MGFSFFFKNRNQNLFEGLTDIHNHILPYIDDGSKNIDMSIEMIKEYKELGVKKIIPTPHIYKSLYPNDPETILNSFSKLSKKYKNSDLIIDSYAAEYMVDEFFLKNLKNKESFLLLNNELILVEINFFSETEILEHACFELSKQRILPLLAHPERYHMVDSISKYKELKNKGFCFQLNALSLLGHYGKKVRQKSEEILKHGLYDYVASDAHNPRHLKILKKLKLSRKLRKHWDSIQEFQKNEFS